MWPDPSLIGLPFPCPGNRYGLTGEPGTDEIDRCELVARQFGEILVAFDIGPVPGEYLPAERIDLDLPCDRHPRTLETKIEAPNTGAE